ncbi:uncharacterized protein LOC120343520 [Styela clava]|uniref:uncharacterized protein LOC120343520 n=1 Tax=Styela clava TaxID=7725 RepID=UPI00193A0366|nr:uncharacterized protein LOC120343520 [Styela clava]
MNLPIYVLSLIISVVNGNIFLDSECNILSSKSIEWNRLQGLWYLTLNHEGDHLSSDRFCIATTYFGIVGDGVAFVKHVISRNGDPETKLISYPEYYQEDHNMRPGTVMPQPVSQLKYMKDTLYLRPNAVTDVFTELLQSYKSPATFSTDYDTYYMIEQCGADGKRMVHVYTRSENPSESEISIVNDALKSRNVNATMVVSDSCVDIGLAMLK